MQDINVDPASRSADLFGFIGAVLDGRFAVTSIAGKGGFGVVYRGHHLRLDVPIAVKCLRPPVDLDMGEREAFLASLRAEAKTLHRLSKRTASIVQAMDVGETNAPSGAWVPYLVMEWLEGETLRQHLDERRRLGAAPRGIDSAVSLLTPAAQAIAAAHEANIAHLDIKPSNLMLIENDGKNQLKVLDFGVARTFTADPRFTVTKPGDVVSTGFTPRYAAPEQFSVQYGSTGPWTDVFSMTLLLIEVASGRPGVEEDCPMQAFLGSIDEGIRSTWLMKVPGLNEGVHAVLRRALDIDPRMRFRTMGAFWDALQAALTDAELGGTRTSVPLASRKDRSSWTPPRDSMPSEATALPPPRSARAPVPGVSQVKARAARFVGSAAILSGGLAAFGGASVRYTPSSVSEDKQAAPGPTALPPEIVLRIHGSNSMDAELIPSLAEAFLEREKRAAHVTRTKVRDEELLVTASLPNADRPQAIEVHARGSSTAFSGLQEGACDIGASSRPVSQEEAKRLSSLGDMSSGACEHVIAIDGVAIIVNRTNPVSEMTLDQLNDIFTGKTRAWSALGGSPSGPIHVYVRDRKSGALSGTFDVFKTLVLHDGEVRSDAEDLRSNAAIAEKVSVDAQGIGIVGLSAVGAAKALDLGTGGGTTAAPSVLDVATERYPLTRRLYLYTAEKLRNVWASEFVRFALSSEGQRIVRRLGFVDLDLTEKLRAGMSSCAGCPQEYKDVVHGTKRVFLDFHFRSAGTELDSRGYRDVSRLAELMRELPNRGKKLILVGFSDNLGTPEHNRRLSLERARAVDRELQSLGLPPSDIKGVGAAMPVGSNATEAGREKNRRVEVWIR